MTSVPSKKKIESFQDLVVWQKSMDLVAECYQLAHRLPQNEQYGWLLRCGAQPFQFLPISLRAWPLALQGICPFSTCRERLSQGGRNPSPHRKAPGLLWLFRASQARELGRRNRTYACGSSKETRPSSLRPPSFLHYPLLTTNCPHSSILLDCRGYECH
jgi:23S rRNA-intervening sequence protein